MSEAEDIIKEVEQVARAIGKSTEEVYGMVTDYLEDLEDAYIARRRFADIKSGEKEQGDAEAGKIVLEVEYSQGAEEEFSKIGDYAREKIEAYFEHLAKSIKPNEYEEAFTSTLYGMLRCYVEDYRVTFKVIGGRLAVLVIRKTGKK